MQARSLALSVTHNLNTILPSVKKTCVSRLTLSNFSSVETINTRNLPSWFWAILALMKFWAILAWLHQPKSGKRQIASGQIQAYCRFALLCAVVEAHTNQTKGSQETGTSGPHLCCSLRSTWTLFRSWDLMGSQRYLVVNVGVQKPPSPHERFVPFGSFVLGVWLSWASPLTRWWENETATLVGRVPQTISTSSHNLAQDGQG